MANDLSRERNTTDCFLQEYFVDSSSQVHSIVYEYSFLHPISKAVMSCLAGIIANGDLESGDRAFPVTAWQTGVIRVSGPLTIGLQLVKSGVSKNRLF